MEDKPENKKLDAITPFTGNAVAALAIKNVAFPGEYAAQLTRIAEQVKSSLNPFPFIKHQEALARHVLSKNPFAELDARVQRLSSISKQTSFSFQSLIDERVNRRAALYSTYSNIGGTASKSPGQSGEGT